MSRLLFTADAVVPKNPKARFMKRLPPGSPGFFEDVTPKVCKLAIRDVSGPEECFALERSDKDNLPVWTTRHHSLQEARWQAKFEYEIDDAGWQPADAALENGQNDGISP